MLNKIVKIGILTIALISCNNMETVKLSNESVALFDTLMIDNNAYEEFWENGVDSDGVSAIQYGEYKIQYEDDIVHEIVDGDENIMLVDI